MNKETYHKHVDKRLKTRIRIYIVICIVLIGIISYDLITHLLGIKIAFATITLGIFGGVFTARMFKLSWDKHANKIISRLDMFGGSILITYIIFAIFRTRIVGEFVHGPALGAASLAVLTGIMIGRVIGTRGKIIKILREEKII